METVVCFKHKELKLCLDMKYLREHRGKIIRFVDGLNYFKQHDYKVDEIPFSDDWEMEVKYFEPQEVSRIVSDVGLIDRDLREKLYKITDFK